MSLTERYKEDYKDLKRKWKKEMRRVGERGQAERMREKEGKRVKSDTNKRMWGEKEKREERARKRERKKGGM